jgi:endoglucanase
VNNKLLEKLCNVNGGSGDESAVRELIYEEIKSKADKIVIDNLGNMLVTKKGNGKSGVKIAVTAHMDEVSFIVTAIRDDGTLAFEPVGGVNADSVLGRRITVNGKPGVIGSKAVHNLTDDEIKSAPKFGDFSVDIGALTKADASKYVSLGDRIYFAADYVELGNGCAASKAIDDRYGCAALISLINREWPCDITFGFLVQEEVGCRGAKAAELDVDYAIVVETTTAADFDGVTGDKRCCLVGEGAVVSFMDRSTVYDRELFALSKKVAAEGNIKWQTKTLVAGGNDASALNIKNGGIKTCAISIPCRYLHSANDLAKLSDMDAVEALVGKMIEAIAAK